MAQPDMFRPGVTLPALDRDAFTAAVAERYASQSGLSPAEAAAYAKDSVAAYLDMEEIEFGAPDYDWTAAGARDVADEDMACW